MKKRRLIILAAVLPLAGIAAGWRLAQQMGYLRSELENKYFD